METTMKQLQMKVSLSMSILLLIIKRIYSAATNIYNRVCLHNKYKYI